MDQWKKARLLWRLDGIFTWVAVAVCLITGVAALLFSLTGDDGPAFVMFGLAVIACVVSNWHPVIFKIDDTPSEDS